MSRMSVQIAIYLSLSVFIITEGVEKRKAAEKWIIDTDAGVDDAVAIFTFLAFETSGSDIELIGITASQGNTNVDNVARNVLKILATANRLDIPVYKGANQSLLITPPSDNFFGEDGFGDFDFPNPPSEDLLQNIHAVAYLTEIVKAYPGQINLLAIAPLTNVAMAARMDPEFLGNLKSLFILGGSIQGTGNVRPGIEFNFFADPEAAFIVLEEAKIAEKVINLLSWETAISVGISNEWRKNVFGAIPTKVVEIINLAENKSAGTESSWISSDTYAVLWAIDSALHVDTTLTSGRVETSGAFTRGLLLLDYQKSTDEFQQLMLAVPNSLNNSYIQDKLVDMFENFS